MKVFLLQDCRNWKRGGGEGEKFSIVIATLLSATSVSDLEKAANPPATESWREKAKYMFLMSKHSTVNKYRMGNCKAVLQILKE